MIQAGDHVEVSITSYITIVCIALLHISFVDLYRDWQQGIIHCPVRL